MKSIDLDYDYVSKGAYYIKLPNDTYLFEVVSDFSGKSAFITLALNANTGYVDLEACE